jgi:hypothetical protein
MLGGATEAGAKPDGAVCTEQEERNMKSQATEIKRFTQSLPCPLTPSELLERADLASHVLQQRDEAEQRMKADASQHKANIQEKEAELRRLTEEIRQRRTFRPVDCERIFDYSAGTVRDVRSDTGEELNRRDLTNDERQRHLDLEEPPDQPKRRKRDESTARDHDLERVADEEGAKIAEADAATEAAEKVERKRRERKARGGRGA